MGARPLSRLLLVSFIIVAIGFTVAADDKPAGRPIEPWADAKLSVTRGLTLWLDAARLNAGRTTNAKPAIHGGLPIDIWPDASGNGLHLSQPDIAARPTFHDADGYRAVRFDGERTFLAQTKAGKAFDEFTIIVVTAPFTHMGPFPAFLALNATGQNDFTSGLTLDQGPFNTPQFQWVNPEGAGFLGAVNLMKSSHPFGSVVRLCCTSAIGAGGTKLFVNGQPEGQRDRAASNVRMDEIRVGARNYEIGGAPLVRGFLDGDVAEVLIYDRVLSADERAAVDGYLATKYGPARTVPLPPRAVGGKPLVAVANPPPVQMFVPGFTVRQLPVDLTNINNVLYRPDGKLVALAYDGNIYLLSDADGDGLEDKAELFWESKGSLRAPIGMDLTPPGYKHGEGVFVAAKGRCSLIVDTDKDGKADKEIIVAEGWKEIMHGVDALGVAVNHGDGSVSFGLGSANFTNPYLVGKDGAAGYRLASERGTIMRVSPDFKSREIVATGIRFPVGIRINHSGDLFCTDQEGATWLANGNPLDELLHVQKGRHYGFPPRHPKHLPGVIDEPSVFDYAPQHQSTCGLNFNEPVNGGPVFGPARWQSDAFVAGYSRGKLYRTALVDSPGGYVARTQLLASLNMLACDVCVSPRGDLVVATHSGGPDWGSGPAGKGKLFKISYTGRDEPQPVFAWPAAPREVRVAFDRPLEPRHLKEIAKATIEYGKYVGAGDRFEALRPGYQAVQDQMRTARYDLPVIGVQITGDRRTLILATAPQPEAVNYALTLPAVGIEQPKSPSPPAPLPQSRERGEVMQRPEIDLGYDLSGVEATWEPAGGGERVVCWLPHLDTHVSRHLTVGSASHDEFWQHGLQPGTLVLRTKVVVKDMLRPAVQPGAKIDYEWPPETVTLTLTGRQPVEVRSSATVGERTDQRTAVVTIGPNADGPVPLEIRLPTGPGEPSLNVTWQTNEDARPRALPLRRFLVPWAVVTSKPDAVAKVPTDIPELAGGDWARGRAVFFGDDAACSKCHSFWGRGGAVGPDLSNLPQRDYHSVLRDIAEPSFAINPDYITQIITLRDGRVLKGPVRTQGDKLLVGNQDGTDSAISRADVEEMQSSPLSAMPEGLPKHLGPDRMRDLLTFLLTGPPHMPDYGPGKPPEPRSMTEVRAVLAGAPERLKTRPIHVVLVAGRKDHGPGEHDYPAWQKVWRQLMSMAADTTVTTANDWPTADELKAADALVFNQQGKWTPERAKDIDAFLARGGGLVYIHYAVDGGSDVPGFAQRIGLAWWGGRSKFRHGPLDLGFQAGKDHPIARNLDKVHFHDESYWRLTGDPGRVNLLATGMEDGQEQPLFWTLEPSNGRVFVSIPGHFAWTFDDPLFRVLLLRGIAWVAKEPVDRFNDLVTPGARIKD
jgi:putative heme-binding domain-containing protein